MLQVFLHYVHEEFDLFGVFWSVFFKCSISTILILQTKVVCCPGQTGCCGTCDVTTPKHRNPDWPQTWTTDNRGQIIKSIWIPIHQYLSHLLTSNYYRLRFVFVFGLKLVCNLQIMNCFNLSFQQLAERIASPPPFPSVKSPITVSPPTSFPTMKSPVREMVSERGNRSESPPSRGMSIIFIYDHALMSPIFPCL